MLKSLTRIAIIAMMVLGWLSLIPDTAYGQEPVLLGAKERVKLLAPGGQAELVAKIDTGADYSSLDRALAKALACEPGGKKIRIGSGNGSELRQTANVTFMLAGREITTRVTLTDRSGLSTRMLIGRNDMAGFIVDPNRQFLTRPDALPVSPVVTLSRDDSAVETFETRPRALPVSEVAGPGANPSPISPVVPISKDDTAVEAFESHPDGAAVSQAAAAPPPPGLPSGASIFASMIPFPLASTPEALAAPVLPSITDILDDFTTQKILLIIPILGVAIVVARLLIGVRTYGVFGPVVIALTLLQLGVVQGTIFYLLLLVIGVGIQTFFLSQLRLPHVAQFSLILFTLVIVVTAVSYLSGGAIPLSSAVFPLIITSHLIEQASQNVAEQRFGDVLSVLTTTLGMAVILGLAGTFLMGLSTGALWVIFGISVTAVIASGRYLGLRLSELLRFRFLRKTHVHK